GWVAVTARSPQATFGAGGKRVGVAAWGGKPPPDAARSRLRPGAGVRIGMSGANVLQIERAAGLCHCGRKDSPPRGGVKHDGPLRADQGPGGCPARRPAAVREKGVGGARRDRTVDLLHAMPYRAKSGRFLPSRSLSTSPDFSRFVLLQPLVTAGEM